jgi:predicted SnoaL-like aldol condensation-catalyzing enzyme
MKVKTALSITFGVMIALVASRLLAQQPPPPAQQSNPAPGCKVSAKELEENRKVAMEFFRTTGEGRVALADPSYKQHNPQFKKRGQDAGETDYEEFKKFFVAAAGRGPAPLPAGQPAPPTGNPFEVVTAECDIVTMIHKVYRQDPTAAPGTFYEAFTFDTFRVNNGKLTEHWDGALIMPPAPAEGAPAGR